MGRSLWWLGFLLFFGCVSIRPPHIGVVPMSGTTYPKRTAIVLLTDPTKPYEALAIIEGRSRGSHSYSDVVNAMRKKAGELGAHAIVIAPPTKESGLIMKGVMFTHVKGVAIRYKQ